MSHKYRLIYFFHSQPATSTRQHRQNRGRMNGQTISQGNVHLGTYMPQAQQPAQSMASSKEVTTQQVCFVSHRMYIVAKMFVVIDAYALPAPFSIPDISTFIV